MKKRLSKTIWYGSDVDTDGLPLVPGIAENAEDLEGLHHGELFLHEGAKPSLWVRTASDEVKKITGVGEDELDGYVTIDGDEKITGAKDFTGGLSVNGGPIVYESTSGYWKLVGDLIVTGGVTMYANEGTYTPSQIVEAIPFDKKTIWLNEETGVVEVIGGSGEGVSSWNDLKDKPTYLGDTGLANALSLIVGSTTTTYNGSEAKSVVIDYSTLGLDDLYLKLTGGTMSGSILMTDGFYIETTYDIGGIEQNSKYYGEGFTIRNRKGGISLTTNYGFIDLTSTDGMKLNGGLITYDITNGYFKLDGDLLVTGGISMYSSDTAFTPSTIMDGVLVDDETIGKNESGQLYLKGGGGSGDASFENVNESGSGNAYSSFTVSEDGKSLTLNKAETFATQTWVSERGYATQTWVSNQGYATQTWVNNQSFATQSWVNNKGYATQTWVNNKDYATQTWVGNYYLPLAGGTITGDLRLQGSGNYGNSLLFGDRNYCYLKEDTDDHLTIYASAGVDINFGSSYQCKVNGNLMATGGVTMYSDIRKKEILEYVGLSVEQIADAPLVKHYYKDDESKTEHVGSIAQYWAGLNDWFCKPDAEGYLTMEIQNAALASAISIAREFSQYKEETEKRIKELEDKVEQLINVML